MEGEIPSPNGEGNRIPTFAEIIGAAKKRVTDSSPPKYRTGTKEGKPAIYFSRDDVKRGESYMNFSIVLKFPFEKPLLSVIREEITRVWGIVGEFTLGSIDFRHVLMRVESEAEVRKVLSRSQAHIRGYKFKAYRWTSDFNVEKESSVAAVWIAFPGLDHRFWQPTNLIGLGKQVGSFVKIHDETLSFTKAFSAKVCVEIELKKPLVNEVWVGIPAEEGFWQPIKFLQIPKFCEKCLIRGHNFEECWFNLVNSKKNMEDEKKKHEINDETKVSRDNKEEGEVFLDGGNRYARRRKNRKLGKGEQEEKIGKESKGEEEKKLEDKKWMSDIRKGNSFFPKPGEKYISKEEERRNMYDALVNEDEASISGTIGFGETGSENVAKNEHGQNMGGPGTEKRNNEVVVVTSVDDQILKVNGGDDVTDELDVPFDLGRKQLEQVPSSGKGQQLSTQFLNAQKTSKVLERKHHDAQETSVDFDMKQQKEDLQGEGKVLSVRSFIDAFCRNGIEGMRELYSEEEIQDFGKHISKLQGLRSEVKDSFADAPSSTNKSGEEEVISKDKSLHMEVDLSQYNKEDVEDTYSENVVKETREVLSDFESTEKQTKRGSRRIKKKKKDGEDKESSLVF